MPLGWAQVSIAGVEIKDASGSFCKCSVLDKAKQASGYTGSTSLSANGTPDAQVFSVSPYGRPVGIQIFQVPEAKRDEVLAAIESSLPDPFLLHYEDDHDSNDVLVLPDWQAGWYTVAPAERTHPTYIRDIIFRFQTQGEYIAP